MRYSKQREIILNTVLNNCNHPDAYTIYELVKKELPNISLGTVYRNLNDLSEAGLINKIVIPNGNDRFDKTLYKHSHFICESCGEVSDLLELDTKNINEQLKKLNISVNNIDLNVSGICHNCK